MRLKIGLRNTGLLYTIKEVKIYRLDKQVADRYNEKNGSKIRRRTWAHGILI